ncbi:mCG1050912 [Mus musculus]|nr:mCG1050912 [Mus musculus]
MSEDNRWQSRWLALEFLRIYFRNLNALSHQSWVCVIPCLWDTEQSRWVHPFPSHTIQCCRPGSFLLLT